LFSGDPAQYPHRTFRRLTLLQSELSRVEI
jgi:hypothetical protein